MAILPKCPLLRGSASYTYDALDRLVKVVQDGQEITYTYDSFNRRLTKNTSNEETDFLYQQQVEIGAYENGQLKELRVLGIGKTDDIGAAVLIKTLEGLFAPIHDHHGNVMALIDINTGQTADAYRYTAFGEEEISPLTSNPWRWGSKRKDQETGFVYFGERYYSPTLGRWVTADPVGYKDGPNLYAYVHNNPLTCIDAFGLFTEQEEGVAAPSVGPTEDRGENRRNNLTFIPELEHVKKKTFSREKTAVHDLGLPEPTNLAASYVNGIHTLLKFAKNFCRKIAEMAGNRNLRIIHNAPRGGIIPDLIRSFFRLYFHLRFSAETALKKEWDMMLKSLPADVPILHYCHSEGAIVTRNALEHYGQGHRIIVVAIAPGAYIDSALCKEVYHYRSTRDIVPLCDVAGLIRCRNTTTVLKPHPDAPWFDHSIDSPTYSRAIKIHMDMYIEKYGAKNN